MKARAHVSRAWSKAWAWSFVVMGAASCAPAPDTLADGAPVVETYAEILYASYDDARSGAVALRTSATPLFSSGTTASAAALTAAREAWQDARGPYMQSEVGRFYQGPIGEHSAFINEWPIDEARIDYVTAADGSIVDGGIIESPADVPTIDEATLRAANLPAGSETVTTGYHAIELLLWGQDRSADGPGARPFGDYLDGTGTNADRRRAYLDVTSQMLVDDLTAVRDAWAPATAGNYRDDFVALPPREAIHRVLIGLIRLTGGEVAEDRIAAAYVDKLQEEEHSCFSDFTSEDLASDVLGVVNVYEGRYVRTDGTTVSGASLSDLVRARDAALDARVRTALETALADVRAWPSVASCPSTALQGRCPFDQLFLGVDTDPGRVALWHVHEELLAIADMLRTEVAPRLGITITEADLTND